MQEVFGAKEVGILRSTPHTSYLNPFESPLATMERKSVGILGGSGFSPFLLNLSSAIH